MAREIVTAAPILVQVEPRKRCRAALSLPVTVSNVITPYTIEAKSHVPLSNGQFIAVLCRTQSVTGTTVAITRSRSRHYTDTGSYILD